MHTLMLCALHSISEQTSSPSTAIFIATLLCEDVRCIYTISIISVTCYRAMGELLAAACPILSFYPVSQIVSAQQ